ncbi:hypothetical protein [Alkaliphilus crotonatoxidans]
MDDKHYDIMKHLESLEKERGFFQNVEEINRLNIDAIIELIQYENVKELGKPLFTRREIRQGLKKYFEGWITD